MWYSYRRGITTTAVLNILYSNEPHPKARGVTTHWIRCYGYGYGYYVYFYWLRVRGIGIDIDILYYICFCVYIV